MKDLKKVGRVTNDSVLKGSGKGWAQWITLLNKLGGQTLSRSEIVQLLKTKYRLSPWWQQGVAHGYEVAIGRRIDEQSAKGTYLATVTKSIDLNAKKLWLLMVSNAGLRIWTQPVGETTIAKGSHFETTDGFFGEVRSLLKGKRIRLSWIHADTGDRSTLQVLTVGRPGKKTILVFNHEGLKSLKEKQRFRSRWREAAEKLVDLSLHAIVSKKSSRTRDRD